METDRHLVTEATPSYTRPPVSLSGVYEGGFCVTKGRYVSPFLSENGCLDSNRDTDGQSETHPRTKSGQGGPIKDRARTVMADLAYNPCLDHSRVEHT